MYKVKKKLVCLDATTSTTTNKQKTNSEKDTILRKNQENSSDPIFLFEECECVHEDEKQILFSFFSKKKLFADESQCGNDMIFLSLRFYVKSILRTLEVQNKPF